MGNITAVVILCYLTYVVQLNELINTIKPLKNVQFFTVYLRHVFIIGQYTVIRLFLLLLLLFSFKHGLWFCFNGCLAPCRRYGDEINAVPIHNILF